MTIAVGHTLPSITLFTKNENEVQKFDLSKWSLNKKVVFFFVPGAFTQTCSKQHLPGFVSKRDEFAKKGVDAVACISVNDPHVMLAWGQQTDAIGKIEMLSDPRAEFATALGTVKDFGQPLGIRSKRCGFVTEGGVITYLHIEEPGELSGSSAIEMLAALDF